MKKLIWTLSALALTGLCFSACGDDDEESCPAGQVWDTAKGVCVASGPSGNVTCDQDASICTGDTSHCVKADLGGNFVCAAVPKCPENQIFDADGKCIADSYRVECKIHADCDDTATTEYICGKENKCVPKTEAGNVYRYVRIDDLSPLGDDASADPGADIDSIVLYNATSGKLAYVEDIKAYKPNLEKFKEKNLEGNHNVAGDPTKVKGKPDAFTSYTNAGLSDSKCVYRDNEEHYTFVSLGGNGGYLEVEMGAAIENNDKIDILEIGGCKLENAGTSTGQNSFREKIQIQVSLTADSNSWVPGKIFDRSGYADGDGLDKGLLSWEVTGLQ